MMRARNPLASLGARARARGTSRGFTLIELAITAVCVSILAVTAVASYQWATIKTRRSAAQGCLTEAAQFMERYYTTNLTYDGAAVPDCPSDVGDHYTISFSEEPDASGYELQAVPKGLQAERETDCGTMTIDQIGRKAPSEGCW